MPIAMRLFDYLFWLPAEVAESPDEGGSAALRPLPSVLPLNFFQLSVFRVSAFPFSALRPLTSLARRSLVAQAAVLLGSP